MKIKTNLSFTSLTKALLVITLVISSVNPVTNAKANDEYNSTLVKGNLSYNTNDKNSTIIDNCIYVFASKEAMNDYILSESDNKACLPGDAYYPTCTNYGSTYNVKETLVKQETKKVVLCFITHRWSFTDHYVLSTGQSHSGSVTLEYEGFSFNISSSYTEEASTMIYCDVNQASKAVVYGYIRLSKYRRDYYDKQGKLVKTDYYATSKITDDENGVLYRGW